MFCKLPFICYQSTAIFANYIPSFQLLLTRDETCNESEAAPLVVEIRNMFYGVQSICDHYRDILQGKGDLFVVLSIGNPLIHGLYLLSVVHLIIGVCICQTLRFRSCVVG